MSFFVFTTYDKYPMTYAFDIYKKQYGIIIQDVWLNNI